MILMKKHIILLSSTLSDGKLPSLRNMSKIICTLSLLLIIQFSKAQDTIIFDDARVHPVKITRVDDSSISYERRGKTKKVLFKDIMQFKQGEKWFYYNADEKQLEEQSEPFFDFATNPLQHPKNFRYGQFSIGATFTFDISAGTDTKRYYSPADNWRIRIEPEMHFTDWFSLKLPLVMPLTNPDDQSADGLVVMHNAGPQNYSVRGIDFRYRQINNYLNELEESSYPRKSSPNSSTNKSGAGTREILGQIGVTPKFYPFLQQKVAFYIAPSFNIGIANYNQVNYYSTFDYQIDTTTYWTGNPPVFQNSYTETWELLSERLEVNKANFTYFRGELTFGFNFNLTRSLNFSLETGITTDLIPLKPYENSTLTVIRAADGLQFETQSFKPTVLYYRSDGLKGGYLMNRFMLVYRFGGKKVEEI
jgi:hypothetical protein